LRSDRNAVGLPMEAVDTPSLLIDVGALERNIGRMAAFFATVPANLRPHFKTHKTPVIARKQIEAGARGITCAKVGEAEALVEGGIDDVLIANQVVGQTKLARLAGLARHARIAVAVDNPDNVAALSAAAQSAGSTVDVLVEINVGMNRCGVEPGEPARLLARRVLDSRGLRLRGLMGYEGHCQNIADRTEREAAVERSFGVLRETQRLLEASGIPVEVMSGGGTGTHDITGRFPWMTEIQAGSYATMDSTYAKLGLGFECALTLAATVISRPTPERAILDSGMKSITGEFGMPQVKNLPGAKLARLSEEHGTLELQGASPRLGDKIELIPSHGCTTINLHDRFYGVRNGRVEAVWEIAGRGAFR
jgi:D-serine deaminase-like pyridoxal phosphate-dependent protein